MVPPGGNAFSNGSKGKTLFFHFHADSARNCSVTAYPKIASLRVLITCSAMNWPGAVTLCLVFICWLCRKKGLILIYLYFRDTHCLSVKSWIRHWRHVPFRPVCDSGSCFWGLVSSQVSRTSHRTAAGDRRRWRGHRRGRWRYLSLTMMMQMRGGQQSRIQVVSTSTPTTRPDHYLYTIHQAL